jgi:eukaryotic-like serine/threonine-protein kinase
VALRAVEQKIDSADLRSVLYFTGFVLGDTALMQQQLDWAKGRADEHVAFDWQAKTAAASGRRAAAEDFTRRAVTLAVQTDAKELAARYTAEDALRAAAFGDCLRVGPAAIQALALDRTSVPLTRSALALALCGKADSAQPLLDELKPRYPKDTLVNTLWIPTILAAIEVERGNGDRSLESLAHIRFEGAGERWPQYVRARALTLQRNWWKARAEFNELVADRGQVPFSPIGGLAYLRLAQIASEMGNVDEAKSFYTRLFTYWSDADPKLPVLLRARAAYARLPQ